MDPNQQPQSPPQSLPPQPRPPFPTAQPQPPQFQPQAPQPQAQFQPQIPPSQPDGQPPVAPPPERTPDGALPMPLPPQSPQFQPQTQPLPPVQPGQSQPSQFNQQDLSDHTPRSDQQYDPSKSPSDQLGHDASGKDHKAETHHEGASGITKLPIKGLSGPLPAIVLGFIILIFLVMILLYAFVG